MNASCNRQLFALVLSVVGFACSEGSAVSGTDGGTSESSSGGGAVRSGGSSGGGSTGSGASSGSSSGSGSSGSTSSGGSSGSGSSGSSGSTSGAGPEAGSNVFNPPFPRLGAYPIGGPQDYGSAAFRAAAAKYHVVIVSNWQGYSNNAMTMAQIFGDIKSRSTVGTKLFSYINNNETEPDNEQPILTKVSSQHWYLYPKGTSGTPVPSSFSGATETNNTMFTKPDSSGKNWIEWYDDFRYAADVTGDAMDSPNPNGDGFFMDNVFWSPRVDGDWNLDGVTDSQNDPTVQGWYRAGYQHHVQYVRSIWPGSTQLGNVADWGNSNATLGVYDQLLDGGVLEGYLGESWSFETWGGFDVMMAAYRKTMDALAPPKLGIVGDDQSGTDYQGMRYGLAATLMDDGYYYQANGGAYAPPPPWYDEFDSNLGYPVTSARGARQTGPWTQGVWRRDFDRGIVLVNPKGNGAQTVDLGGTFTKLKGTQAPSINDGSTVTRVTLADRDGIVLER